MRIIVVGPRDGRRDRLVEALREAGHDVPGAVSEIATLRRVIRSVGPDHVVVSHGPLYESLPARLDGVGVLKVPEGPLAPSDLSRWTKRGALRSARPGPTSDEGPKPSRRAKVPQPLIAIGASTGGPQIVEAILRGLPVDTPPVVIAQHMPAYQTTRLGERLDRLCAMTVREAVDGAVLAPGEVWIAPGGRHLEVTRRGRGMALQVTDDPLVNGHRPSVDVLFHSIARMGAEGALAIVLTGMGCDGADGLLSLRRAGALTLVQDEASSTVYGMPRVAVERGAATEQGSPRVILSRVLEYAQR